jgi:hypothetical protein
MKAFQRFDPAATVAQFTGPLAAKVAKAAKPQGFRHFLPPNAHLKLAKVEGALGSFSHALATGDPQNSSALAALGALAGVAREKAQTVVLLEVRDGVPEDWAQGVADLLAMSPHPDWPDTAWNTLQNDALAFLRERAAQAYALGWNALDLFGVHATASRARLDGMGLVPLLNGRPITAMSENGAVIAVASGGVQTYRRPSIWLTGRCLVWEPRPCEAVPLGNVRLGP